MKTRTPFPRVPLLDNRQDIVIDLCRGKRVLHVGCVDQGLLHERFERGELLHQRLSESAADLWGVDIDSEGVAFLSAHGFENVYEGDICQLDQIEPLSDHRFDVIVAAEVVEHLANPGQFLRAVRHRMARDGILVVTVPNAFRFDTLVEVFRGHELVHPDHNYWFSYRTITSLIIKSGLKPRSVFVYSFRPTTVLGAARRFWGRRSLQLGSFDQLKALVKDLAAVGLLKNSPFWGDGIIVIAEQNVSQGAPTEGRV